jgi:hypothetical protein
MQLRRGKGNCGGDAELICLVKGPITRFGGESDVTSLHPHSPRVKWGGREVSDCDGGSKEGKVGEGYWCFHKRRRGGKKKKKDDFMRGKDGRGRGGEKQAARGAGATPKRIFWGSGLVRITEKGALFDILGYSFWERSMSD